MIREHNKFVSRPKHVEEKIIKTLSPTKRLENLITSDEVIQLLKIFQKAKKTDNNTASSQLMDDLLNNDDISQPVKMRTRPSDLIQCAASLNWDRGVSEILENKLRKVIPDFDIVGGMFYLNNGSFKLHTDSGSDPNSVIYKIFTIPLKFENNMDIYTPVFNQYWLGSAARFERGADLIENNTHQNITNYIDSPIYDLTNKDFDKKDYKNLSHIPLESLWGFSLESKNKWKVGDVFVIDRAKIHTSCDFSKNKTSPKFFITIVTTQIQ